MERIENSLLRERSFERTVEDVKRFETPGWTNAEGTFVPDESAFDFAIEQCVYAIPAGFQKIKWTEEFREMAVEWFYSGGEWKREN